LFGVIDGVAAHQFIEIAGFAIRSILLNYEREIPVVELIEPFVPAHFFQGIFSAISGKIQANDAYVSFIFGASDSSRFRLPIFCPALDFIMIGKYVGRCFRWHTRLLILIHVSTMPVTAKRVGVLPLDHAATRMSQPIGRQVVSHFGCSWPEQPSSRTPAL